MSVVVTPLRRHRRAVSLDPDEARERSIRRRVGAAWGLLYFNTLTFVPGGFLPLPSRIGRLLTQGSLTLAIFVTLAVNPTLKVRPNVNLDSSSGGC